MEEAHERPRLTRRRLLAATGGILTSPGLAGLLRRRADESIDDSDGDGIPDAFKHSTAFSETLTDLFGKQFGGLAVGRRDFLLDVRYIGNVSIPPRVKAAIVDRFREAGIHMQWLDYPDRYDLTWFEEQYGNNARRILWSRDSFYRNEIESELRNVAFQLIMVPGAPEGRYRGRIFSPWAQLAGAHPDGYINGMNFGNRAVAAERRAPWEQTRLIFHEIAHLALCHDDNPENTGVMGTNRTLTLTTDEWDTLRGNLDNVRDTTGYDVLQRRCLWLDDPGGAGRWSGCSVCSKGDGRTHLESSSSSSASTSPLRYRSPSGDSA